MNPVDITYCYDGSLEGFFSLVFYSYATRCLPQRISKTGCCQLALGSNVVDIPTDMEHAERVRAGLARRAGVRCYNKVKTAFLSGDDAVERLLLRYIERAMDVGHRVLKDVSDPPVSEVERTARSVLSEREKVYQFARFEQLENGVYFACVNPKANVVVLSMEHFVERFSTHPFILYDEVHGIAGVYDCTASYFVKTDSLNVPSRSADELLFQRLWKAFYDSVSNEQRHNPNLRRSWMPKRFWKNITEIKLATLSSA